ncbi:hypothetical protein HZB60_02670 [candidate division KSB1 bacterium]|nr:hypothetical protein [candidate division KSB1 bacterium]
MSRCLLLELLIAALLLGSCDRSSDEQPDPIPAGHARVMGVVTDEADGQPLIDVAFHVVYRIDSGAPARESRNPPTLDEDPQLSQNFPNPYADTTRVAFDLAVPMDVHLWVTAHDADSVVWDLGEFTLVAGHHAIPVANSALANLIYDFHLRAGPVTSRIVMLKNTPNDGRLRAARPLAVSASDGSFALNVAVGQTIALVDDQSHSLGNTTLRIIELVAIKAGYRSESITQNLDPGVRREVSIQMQRE